jgi:hypothetical protein
MPVSSFFGGLQRFAGDVLGQAQRTYTQLDRASGGWLPGGGVASPVTAWQQQQQRQARQERERARSAPPYVGKPGERSNKGEISNALDVLNRAGASPLGFITENPNDMALVKKFFTNNPDVMNQYDLPTNMFLRYYTGVGAKGMQLSPEQESQIMRQFNTSRQFFTDPTKKEEYLNRFLPAVRQSYERKMNQGMTPVFYDYSNPGTKEITNSLGRFWVQPNPEGGYTIDEKFDWGYAPVQKGGASDSSNRAQQKMSSETPLWYSALNGPGAFAENLVSKGYGQPFSYRLNVDPSGNFKVTPQ